MSSFKDIFLRYLRRLGAGSLIISVLIHVVLIICAALWVVSSVKEQRRAVFQGGSGAHASGEMQHKVQMSPHQKNLTALNQRLSVDTPNAMVSLPDLPPAPESFDGSRGTSGKTGGAGAGNGVGIGGSNGPIISSFGFREAQPGGALVGHFYDLKQFHDRRANLAANNPDKRKLALTTLSHFIKNGWSTSLLEKFFMAPKPLYATQIFIPDMNADEAPHSYGVGDVVKPGSWIAHYRGRVSPPASGTYRFVGDADDYMAVRLDGRLVLACGGDLSVNFHSDRPSYVYKPERSNFVQGLPMELRAGLFYNIDIVISEAPGGLFSAMLLFEQEKVQYAKDSKGNPILPIFRVSQLNVEKSNLMPPFMENGPVWRALPPPGGGSL
jgi:hypothetical protein